MIFLPFPFGFGLGAGFGGLGFGADFAGRLGKGGSVDFEGLAVPGDLLLDLVDLFVGGSSPGSPKSPELLPLFDILNNTLKALTINLL